ncbi:lycopene cyclase domain-containing protein [Clavibacter phaseoli]|uniref:lycopene cyclase domain-containing protein n=1 Tax=Clavibacter phaseoli TaxID=1734031 RepID=UPI000E671394|nr:lycopene cyclase domain-containing protein [Clavibacter phaseoli]RIJ55093.1 lycopene cyclase domain-containing protein [Clavibacter phaseoli]UKF32128.1 lycopene cyclase domain-containing protein [Clavibacter phaseoli]UKF38050.1 lycopene cyclase domain-containing protein [Clavibacter phaseoli]
MGLVYLVLLLVAIGCMMLIDRRWRLFFWRDRTAAALTTLIGVAFFLAWDVAGISQGIFFRGETSFMTGILVGPELPLEEVFFLTLLCYLTMNLVNGFSRLADHHVARARERANR